MTPPSDLSSLRSLFESKNWKLQLVAGLAVVFFALPQFIEFESPSLQRLSKQMHGAASIFMLLVSLAIRPDELNGDASSSKPPEE